MMDQRDVVAHLMREVYGDRSETEICNSWEKGILEELMSTIDVTEFIRCLKIVLQVAKGKNAVPVENLIQRIEILFEQNPNSPEMLNLLKEIADLTTIKAGSIAKTNFLGRGVTTKGIETEIDFLVSVMKRVKTAPVLEKNDKETDDNFLISTTRDLLTLYTPNSQQLPNC